MRNISSLSKVALMLTVALVVPTGAHAAPNLAPNPGFEDSVLEPADALHGVQPQPILPTGWAFEGLAGLFDHSPNDKHTGLRSAAISAPMSTKRSLCADPPVGCHDNPINPVRDALSPTYSITPFWRTVSPVAVTAGTTYDFSVWTKLSIVTEGEGAITRVRWVDANGLTVGQSDGPKRLNPLGLELIDWGKISGTVKAPSGAKGAILMLGHSDDSWIGQVLFDDVSFSVA